jgi:hypothetical protein
MTKKYMHPLFPESVTMYLNKALKQQYS